MIFECHILAFDKTYKNKSYNNKDLKAVKLQGSTILFVHVAVTEG